MNYVVQQHKLQNVKYVHVAIGSEVPAILSGNADHALSFEPEVTQGVRQNGLHIVYSFPADQSWSPFDFSSLTSTKTFLKAHPDATQGVVTAFENASRYIYAHPDEASGIAQKYFPDFPKDVVREAVQREIDTKGYPRDALVSKASWDNALHVAVYAKHVSGCPSKATSYEKNVDTVFATRPWLKR